MICGDVQDVSSPTQHYNFWTQRDTGIHFSRSSILHWNHQSQKFLKSALIYSNLLNKSPLMLDPHHQLFVLEMHTLSTNPQ